MTSADSTPVPAVTVPDRLIPISEIQAYPSILSDGSIDGAKVITGGFDTIPLRALPTFTSDRRTALVDAILADLGKWNAPESARESARVLLEENSYAVVTGQQAGIGSGPLYTLYKAIGTIRVAEELRRAHPEQQFVPVFWIEADDHDFEEVRSLTLLDPSNIPVTVKYDDGDTRPLRAGDRLLNGEGLVAMIEAIRGALQPTEFSEEMLALVADAYISSTSLADGFARICYALLGDTPLVLVASTNGGVKALAADIFAREAADPDALYQAVQARTEELRQSGVAVPIDPKRGSLFIVHEGERRWLDPGDDRYYTVRGTDERISFDEVAGLARTHPEQLSPKVSLRPIVQDAILPTAIYLGGPSEVAYLNQILDAYSSFGLAAPAVAPRPFVLLLEPKVKRVLENAGISLPRLMESGFSAAALLVDKEMEEEIERRKAMALKQIEAACQELAPVTARIDSTLEKSLGAATATAVKSIDDFSRKLNAALRKKQQTEIDRLAGARAMVAPGGSLQERTLNPLYIVNKYGLGRFRAALEKIALEPGMLQVIDL